jgi:branched-chain amino acid transport system permease protein
MTQFITAVLTSLSSGAIYALMALAIVLVWRSTRVINFAQAGQAVLTTYIGYTVIQRTGSYWLALVVAVISGAIIGAVIDRFFMRPIFKRIKSGPIVMIAPVVATLGLLGIIQAIIGFIWGLSNLSIETPVSTDGYEVMGKVIAFSSYNLLVLVSVSVAMLLLTILFQRTDIGLALRASAYSPEIARLSGIKVDAVRTLGWAIAGAAGGLAGMLYIPGYVLFPCLWIYRCSNRWLRKFIWCSSWRNDFRFCNKFCHNLCKCPIIFPNSIYGLTSYFTPKTWRAL